MKFFTPWCGLWADQCKDLLANHVGYTSCDSLMCFWNRRRKNCRLIFAVQRLVLFEKEKILLFEMQARGIVGRHNTEHLKIKIRESSRTNQCNCKDTSQQPPSSYAVQIWLQFNQPFTPCNFTIPWKMTHRWNSSVWHGRMPFMGRKYIFFSSGDKICYYFCNCNSLLWSCGARGFCKPVRFIDFKSLIISSKAR